MDEEQFVALREWGEGLILDQRAEVRAAGKAILLLCAEVERLQIALWNLPDPASRLHAHPGGDNSPAAEPPEPAGPAEPAQELLSRARRFLRARLGR